MGFYDKVYELCIKKGISITSLAMELGFSKGTPTNWKTMTKPPRAENVKKIADYFGVPVEFLIERNISNVEPVKYSGGKGVSIPVYGRVAAGTPIEAIEDIIDYEEIDADMARLGDHFALKISGDSMEPRMYDGDIVIVRQQPSVDSGDIAIVIINGLDATCKKIIKKKDGIELVSLNPSYSPMFYSNAQIEELPVKILGKVVELRGKF
jgi:repressor LexA